MGAPPRDPRLKRPDDLLAYWSTSNTVFAISVLST